MTNPRESPAARRERWRNDLSAAERREATRLMGRDFIQAWLHGCAPVDVEHGRCVVDVAADVDPGVRS